MTGPHLSLLQWMFNHLQSPLLITQSQLIKHVLTNPSRQLSVKQARLPLESKNTFSTSMTIALKKSFAYTWISPPPPPPGNTLIFEKTKKCMQ